MFWKHTLQKVLFRAIFALRVNYSVVMEEKPFMVFTHLLNIKKNNASNLTKKF